MFGMVQTLVQPDSLIYAYAARMWYDARTISGVDGSGVDFIPNRSGTGNFLTQSVTARKPILKHGIAGAGDLIRFAAGHALRTPNNADLSDLTGLTYFIVGSVSIDVNEGGAGQTVQFEINSGGAQPGAITLFRNVTNKANFFSKLTGVTASATLARNVSCNAQTKDKITAYAVVNNYSGSTAAQQLSHYSTITSSFTTVQSGVQVLAPQTFTNPTSYRMTLGGLAPESPAMLGDNVHFFIIPRVLTQTEITTVFSALKDIHGSLT
jgi:hypothetical protein